MINKLAQSTPINPASVIQKHIQELEIDIELLADHFGVHLKTFNQICQGKRRISLQMAIKLSLAFGSTPNYWLKLQKNWDARFEESKSVKVLERIAA